MRSEPPGPSGSMRRRSRYVVSRLGIMLLANSRASFPTSPLERAQLALNDSASAENDRSWFRVQIGHDHATSKCGLSAPML